MLYRNKRTGAVIETECAVPAGTGNRPRGSNPLKPKSPLPCPKKNGGRKMTYAAREDMTTLWRPMTSAEQARASSLLEVVSASLNMEAQKVGKDLPALVAADPDLAMVAKSVTVDVVAAPL